MNETSIKTLQCLQFVSSYRSFIQYSAIQYITMLSIVVFPVNRAVTAASVSVPSIQGNGCIFYVSCVFVSACMKLPPDVFCEEEEAFLCRWHLNKTQNISFLLLLFFPPLKNMITAQMKQIPNERNLHSSSVISLKFVLMSFWSFLSLNLESLCVCI